MKKKLQKNFDFKKLGFLLVIALLLFSSNSANAQFSATWPFTSGLGATVTGAANVTASDAFFTSGATNLFTNTTTFPPTTTTGSLVGTGISGRALSSCTGLYNAVGVAPAVITPYLEYKLAPNSGYSMTTNSFTFTVNPTTTVTGVTVAAGYSFDNGASFTGLLPTGGTVAATGPIGSTAITANATLTFTVPATTVGATSAFILRIVVWRNNASNSGSTNIFISSPTIVGTTPVSATPVIAAPVPNTLTGFTYITGSGPSSSQSFAVAGANLTGDITATASTNYEVSSDNVSFSGSATVPQVSGTASGTLYTRLKSGLAAGTYNSEIIVLSSPTAPSQNVSCSGGVSALYYYNGTGALADVSSWGLNTDGTGTNPANFTTAYQTFILRNTTAVSTTAAWTVSGTGSKIILGDASSAAVALTIEAGFGITGTLDIAAASSGSNTLVVKHSAVPTFGSLNATSTIDIQSAVTFTGSQTFSNNVSVSNGGILTLSNVASGNIYTFGGNLSVTGAGGIKNTPLASPSNTLVLSGTGKTYTNIAVANDFSKTNFTINGTYSLANDFKYNTTLSGSRTFTIGASGSLDLNGKRLSLDNSGSITIISGGIFTANGAGSTIEFFGNQVIPTTILYHNLILSGGSKTIPAGLSIANDLAIDGFTAAIAQDLTVNNNLTLGLLGALTLNTGKNLTVKNALINNATAGAAAVVIENGANLIQGSATTVNANTGNITVKRNSNALFRLDYTAWSSPVTGTQTLADFSPMTSQAPSRFYSYDTAFGTSGAYSVIASPTTTTFTAGSGYLIRMPNTDPTVDYDAGIAPLSYPGSFSGVANNGNVPVTLAYVDAAHSYNLVGNPYPSVIDANTFISSNSTNIETALYFWRKTNGLGTAYAVYNSLGGTAASSTSEIPNGKIQVGQGFFV